MSKNFKVLIISFILFMPLWWGVNVLADNLENFWYLKTITQNPNLLNARINFAFDELELKKIKEEKQRKNQLGSLNIIAESAIVAEINSNYETEILFEKNPKKVRPIASLTKLMTALVVFDLDETYDLLEEVTITPEAVGQEGVSKFENLKIGDRISIGSLIYKMLIESSNDAAYAITQPIGEPAFAALMNIYANQIGLEKTYFFNSTGLEFNGNQNTSTALDLVKISKYILQKHPEIFEITADRKFTTQNTNKLLAEYPEIIGGKTGWTPSASGCLLVVTKSPKEKKYYVSVILGAQDRFAQMRKILNTLK